MRPVLRPSAFVVVGVAALIAAACSSSGPATTTPATTATPPTTTAPTTTSTSTTSTSTSTSTTLAETTIPEGPKTLGSDRFVVPFSMVPEEGSFIREGVTVRDEYVDFVAGENEWLLLSTAGPSSVDGWVALLTDGRAVAAEPFPAVVGGATGSAIDAVAEGVEFPILSLPPDGEFWADIDDSIRVYVLDVDGQTVSIVVTTGTENFESWIEEIEALLATLEWGVAP